MKGLKASVNNAGKVSIRAMVTPDEKSSTGYIGHLELKKIRTTAEKAISAQPES